MGVKNPNISPEAKARQVANLSPYRKGEQVHRMSTDKGLNTQYAMNAALGKRPPGKLTPTEWDLLYTDVAFDPDWSRFFRQTLKELQTHYAPNRKAMPQYRALTWRLAVWMTRAAQLDVLAGWQVEEKKRPGDTERLAVEFRVQALIQALQRYTEAEKRVDFLITTNRDKMLEHFVAVAEHAITDKVQLDNLFTALKRAIELNALSDDRALRQMLPAKTGTPDIIDHVAATETIEGESE